MTEKNRQDHHKFGLGGAVLYGINAVIGSGIFLLPKRIYGGLGPVSLVVMLATTVSVVLLALCYAEMAGYVNKNGGAYQYSKRAFGEFVGFNVGFLGWLVTIIGWAAMAAAFARLFIVVFPMFTGYDLLLSIALVIALAAMNLSGIKTSKNLTIIVTIAKLVPILAFVFGSLFFFGQGVHHFTPFVQTSEGSNIFAVIATSAMAVFYGFTGFESLPTIAGEMRDAKRNVPRAILGSISIIAFLYMMIIAGTIAMLGSDLMNSSAPVSDAFAKMVGPIGAWIISVGALVSITGINMGESIMIPRFGAAIAEDGLLPRRMAKMNRQDAPYVSILLSSGIVVLLLLSGTFETLATLNVVFRFFQYIATTLAVLKLRKAEPNKMLSFRIPFGPVIPILATVLNLLMIVGDSVYNIFYGIAGLVVSMAMYVLLHRKK